MTGFSVEAALNEYVRAVEEPRPPDGKWHPSSLYGCQRKAVYEVRGTPETDEPDDRARRLFRVGHILHQFVQEAVRRHVGTSILQAFSEVPIEIPELGIVGTGDEVVQLSNGAWELWEYKSINSQSAKYNDLPKVEHVGQVVAYGRALRDYGSPPAGIPPLGDDLVRARITYIGKDDLAIYERPVIFTEAKERELVSRVADLEPYREQDSIALPPRLPMEVKKGKGLVRAWPCGYCAFATRCWDQDGEEGMREVALAA